MRYHRVHTAPITQPTNTLPKLQAWRASPKLPKPVFLIAGNVTANCWVGFGDPLTVTVSTLDAVKGLLLDEEAETTLKRGDVAYMTPCVEFMNSKK